MLDPCNNIRANTCNARSGFQVSCAGEHRYSMFHRGVLLQLCFIVLGEERRLAHLACCFVLSCLFFVCLLAFSLAFSLACLPSCFLAFWLAGLLACWLAHANTKTNTHAKAQRPIETPHCERCVARLLMRG